MSRSRSYALARRLARAATGFGVATRVACGLSLTIALAVTVGCTATRSAARSSFIPEVSSASARAALRSVKADPTCVATLLDELERGELGPACADARASARRALARRQPRARFGWIEQRKVDLRHLRLILGEARGCRTWPLREAGQTVLAGKQVREAGCVRRRFTGELPLVAVRGNGERVLVYEVSVANGELDFAYADVDRWLSRDGSGALADFDRLELGSGAWAGTVDLRRLREFLAEWHYRWVRQGRGVPGLFAARHPEHAATGDARALAFEARLARQERDYLAVARAELSPLVFLERHLWSAYRSSVRSIRDERARPATE